MKIKILFEPSWFKECLLLLQFSRISFCHCISFNFCHSLIHNSIFSPELAHTVLLKHTPLTFQSKFTNIWMIQCMEKFVGIHSGHCVEDITVKRYSNLLLNDSWMCWCFRYYWMGQRLEMYRPRTTISYMIHSSSFFKKWKH